MRKYSTPIILDDSWENNDLIKSAECKLGIEEASQEEGSSDKVHLVTMADIKPLF